MLNEEGWFVTAAHILEIVEKLMRECDAVKKVAIDRAAIESNSALEIKEKRKAIGKLLYPPKTSTEECSVWWGKQQSARLVTAEAYVAADLAIGRLEPFNPATIKSFPVFKDPSKPCPNGTSL
ncbi:MAG: hypothetical protein ABIR36_14390, partial [Nitrospiraceae bacterium]